MCEVLSIKVPRCIIELSKFFTHFDQLKQIMLCYKTHCDVMNEELLLTPNSKKRDSKPCGIGNLKPCGIGDLKPCEIGDLKSCGIRNIINVKKPRGTRPSIFV